MTIMNGRIANILQRNRKFKLALLILFSGLGLALSGNLTGDFVALAGVILGAYNFANVANKKVTHDPNAIYTEK